MTILSARDLAKSFGTTAAVDGLDLEVEEGTVAGLIGPDGAGKSTLLRLLIGLLSPTRGSVTLAGQDVASHGERIKDFIGYMPQHFSLYGDLTVAENLRFFADLYGVSKAVFTRRREELLRFSALGPFQDRLSRQLSGGMQKKLALACNLFHTPSILVLDEPTTGVDPVSRRELWDLLGRINKEGVTIVLTTPYMDEAARCGKVGLMFEGRILAYDTPAGLIAGLQREIAELAAPIAPALAALRDCPGVAGVHPFGDTVHVVLQGTEGLGPIERCLAAKNVPVRSLKKIAPSFEDVFLSLSEKRESWRA
jgi:ABC-2 type transport system ATP-binding protein